MARKQDVPLKIALLDLTPLRYQGKNFFDLNRTVRAPNLFIVRACSIHVAVTSHITHGLPGWYNHNPWSIADRPDILDHKLMGHGPLSVHGKKFWLEMRSYESLQPAAAADILILFLDTRRPHQGLPLICHAHRYLQEQGLDQCSLIVAAYTHSWSQVFRHEAILAGHVAHQAGALLVTHALVNAAPSKPFLLQTILSSRLMSEAHADHSLNHHIEALSATLPSHLSTKPLFPYCWCLDPHCRPMCANTGLCYVPYI
ncbi:hypothetical protein C8R43DRAFT_1134311 [Mycena crocata]|nr:hypothetical protein C8R43DRAFT_1134311 [Mycena crocata]